MATLQGLIDSDPENLTKLAKLMHSVHSPALALNELGFANHPSAAIIGNYRDPMHMKIVYHADPATLFRCAPDWSDLIPPSNPDLFAIQDSNGTGGKADGDNLDPRDEKSSALVAYQGESSRSQEIVRRYILQSMKVWLRDDQDKIAAENCRFVYSFPFCPAAIKSLGIIFDNTALKRSLSQSGVLFAQILRTGVGDIKVPHPNDFNRSNLAVVFLEVTKFDQVADSVMVRSDPIHIDASIPEPVTTGSSTPFVLCLDAFPLDTLMKMRRWEVEPELNVSIKLADGMDPDIYGTPYCSKLLADLLAEGSFFLQGNSEGFDVKQSILTDMRNRGLTEQDDNAGWALTSDGRCAVSVSYLLKKRQKVVRIRSGISLQDMETVELLIQMQNDKWKPELVDGKKSDIAKKFYVHDESEKIWYQPGGKDSVCREYLILLLTASSHLQPMWMQISYRDGLLIQALAEPAALVLCSQPIVVVLQIPQTAVLQQLQQASYPQDLLQLAQEQVRMIQSQSLAIRLAHLHRRHLQRLDQIILAVPNLNPRVRSKVRREGIVILNTGELSDSHLPKLDGNALAPVMRVMARHIAQRQDQAM
ncbi:unnamed protein product [Cladocopium goreaui]|uniref:Uncharacterized protein n=1 Tax=Cladocopium goreaui TaxID=2562237 RepID=A0A9P1CSC1_9DINO|nr:unnamed protein product [Cladocopium goreaui]